MSQLTVDEIVQLSNRYFSPFGPEVVAFMTRIALLESQGNSGATGDNFKVEGATRDPAARYDYGLWQINSQHGYDPEKLLTDPEYNAQAARDIYVKQGPQAWSTYSIAAQEVTNMTDPQTDSIWQSILDSIKQYGPFNLAVGANQIGGFINQFTGEGIKIEQLQEEYAGEGGTTDPALLTEDFGFPVELTTTIQSLIGQGYVFLAFNPQVTPGTMASLQLLNPAGQLVTMPVGADNRPVPNRTQVKDIGLGPDTTAASIANGLVPLDGGNYLHPSTQVVYDKNGRIVSDPQGYLIKMGLSIQDYNAQTARQRAQIDRELGLGGLNLGWAQLEADQTNNFDLVRLAEDRLQLDRELGTGGLDIAQQQADTTRALGEADAFNSAYSNETGRVSAGTSALSNAGSLTSDLMKSLAQMGSDPGSAVEREYLTRGLLPPGTSQSIPISGKLDALINRLVDENRLAGEDRSPFEGSDNINPPTVTPPVVTPPAPIVGPEGGAAAPAPIVPGDPEYQAVVKGVKGTKPWQSQNPYIPTAAPAPQPAPAAPVSSIVSPPVASPSSTVSPVPVSNAVRPPQKDYAPDPLGGWGLIRLAEGGTTEEPIIEVGDPQKGNEANPELVITPPGTPKMVIPLSDIMSHKKGTVPKYAFGTLQSAGLSPTVSESLKGNVTTQSNEAYQNLPALKLLRGETDQSTFGKLGQGTQQGAFGSEVPLSGSLNINDVIEADRQGATPLLSALYKAAGLDYSQEVARALTRAPIGGAQISSLVRT